MYHTLFWLEYKRQISKLKDHESIRKLPIYKRKIVYKVLNLFTLKNEFYQCQLSNQYLL